MKKKYSRFRELWAVPKYKNLFKLAGWAIFFALIIILSAIPAKEPNNVNKPDFVSFNKMKMQLRDSNLTVTYQISIVTRDEVEAYLIEGTLVDGIISGTLVINEEMKRLKIDEENVYVGPKGKEEISNILSALNLIYLFPKNIIMIISDNSAILRESDDKKIFSYHLDNKTFSVYTDESAIIKIVILDGNVTYELEYQIIN